MLGMLSNLAKAAIAAGATPVALVADVLTLPASSMDPHRGPFDNTGTMLKTAAECFKEAVKPVKE